MQEIKLISTCLKPNYDGGCWQWLRIHRVFISHTIGNNCVPHIMLLQYNLVDDKEDAMPIDHNAVEKYARCLTESTSTFTLGYSRSLPIRHASLDSSIGKYHPT